ncbi:aldehyde dehydrogenase family protein [Rhodococcus koreensis]|uniref:aldehyde dehydrogenase family protein n=1 Tax=Rhodococcus koreensis TaxID=99653 RepID=UPI000AD68449|nr:aldehyde dehydrogenase family protein [Rhodococcus koreensis]
MSVSMTIDGRLVGGDGTFPVDDPAVGTPFAEAPDCTDEQLEAAVRAAQSAFAQWRLDDGTRRAALLVAAQRIENSIDELAPLFVQEQGKPLKEAAGEVASAIQWLRYYADLDLSDEVLQKDDYSRVDLIREPIGVVAAITPWNSPIGLAFWKLAPALRAGNTIVLKPSPYTPITTLRVGELLADILPRASSTSFRAEILSAPS